MIKICPFSSIAGLILSSLLIGGCVGAVTTERAPKAPSTPAVKEAPKPEWETKWERSLEAARQEKKVVIYTTAGAEIRTAITKAVKKTYDLEVEFVTGRLAELLEKLSSERRAGLNIGDFYIGGTTGMTKLISNYTDPLKPELVLPEVLDTKYWYGNKLPFIEKDGFFFGFRGSVFRPLTVNTSLVKPGEITSYKDLLKPNLKGKIAIGDPTIGGAACTFVTMVGEYFMDYDFIRGLVNHEPFVSRDERLLTEWVARGKHSILIGTKPDSIVEFEKAGAPLLTIIPKEGSVIEPGAGTIAVLNKKPHPNAAKVFLNWLLTKEGQTLYAEAAGIESAREDVSKAHLDAKLLREPGKRYIFADEEFQNIAEKNLPAYKQIFGALLR